MPALNRRKLVAAAFGLALVAAFALPFLRPAPPAPRYTVTDLGVLPSDTLSGATAINNAGAVAGYSWSMAVRYRACLFQEGKVTAIGTPSGAGGSIAYAINSRGDVTGYVALQDKNQAFVFSHGHLVLLGTAPGFLESNGSAISDSGLVAGESFDATARKGSAGHVFLFNHGVLTDLGVLPGAHDSSAHSINTAGQIVGYCRFRGRIRSMPFVYESRRKRMTALPMPPSAIRGEAHAINDQGLVVGSISDSTAGHAALWSDGHLTDLGTPGGYDQAEAEGLNNRGDVVGQCYREPSAFQAFLQSHAGHNNPWQRYVDRGHFTRRVSVPRRQNAGLERADSRRRGLAAGGSALHQRPGADCRNGPARRAAAGVSPDATLT